MQKRQTSTDSILAILGLPKTSPRTRRRCIEQRNALFWIRTLFVSVFFLRLPIVKGIDGLRCAGLITSGDDRIVDYFENLNFGSCSEKARECISQFDDCLKDSDDAEKRELDGRKSRICDGELPDRCMQSSERSSSSEPTETSQTQSATISTITFATVTTINMQDSSGTTAVPTAVSTTLGGEDSSTTPRGGSAEYERDSDDDKDDEERFVEAVFWRGCQQYPGVDIPDNCEACRWTVTQSINYYRGNWTRFCGEDQAENLRERRRRQCRRCDQESGPLNRIEAGCLRRIFIDWPSGGDANREGNVYGLVCTASPSSNTMTITQTLSGDSTIATITSFATATSMELSQTASTTTGPAVGLQFPQRSLGSQIQITARSSRGYISQRVILVTLIMGVLMG